MTRLEIRSLSSPVAEGGEWLSNEQGVLVCLEMEIGVSGEKGADIFTVVVATPEGLRNLAQDDEVGALAHRATIVVREFAWASIRETLRQIVRRCEADTWVESVGRLQRYFLWEYEDYVPG